MLAVKWGLHAKTYTNYQIMMLYESWSSAHNQCAAARHFLGTVHALNHHNRPQQQGLPSAKGLQHVLC